MSLTAATISDEHLDILISEFCGPEQAGALSAEAESVVAVTEPPRAPASPRRRSSGGLGRRSGSSKKAAARARARERLARALPWLFARPSLAKRFRAVCGPASLHFFALAGGAPSRRPLPLFS